ncbi:MAG: hypothetical protein PHG00_07825 [Methylococcales bacterium]|nr:hypothetical protein [Methylococcales bacterium]
MNESYVVDTNVLIAASAIDANSPKARDATPSDPELRRKVWQWLNDFQLSASQLVLDGQGQIEDEYGHKLGFNDFGRQVVQYKWDTLAVNQVHVDYDENGHGILEEPLQTIIHDLADRKMVAAALDAKFLHNNSTIAFAGDTDWHGWEKSLLEAGLELEPIIEEWSRAKFAEKLSK